MYTYVAHGLHIQSDLRLPELVAAECEVPDVVVHYSDTPTNLLDPGLVDGGEELCDTSPGRFSLTLPNQASYLVLEGREVWVESGPNSDDDRVRASLLGSVFGAMLHQRHILALHASCVQTPGGAVLFAGHSGYGKSTLVTALMQRGYPMLADDITGISLGEDGAPIAFPAFPAIRLWTDVAAKLNYPLDMQRRPQLSVEKHVVPASTFCSEPLPVAGIFFLTPHPEPPIRIDSVEGLNRFARIVNSTYRSGFINGLGVRQPHFRLAVEVARAVRLARIKRPSHSFLLEELVDRVEAEIAA